MSFLTVYDVIKDEPKAETLFSTSKKSRIHCNEFSSSFLSFAFFPIVEEFFNLKEPLIIILLRL